MTTITFDALNTNSQRPQFSFKAHSFFQRLEVLHDLAPTGTLLARTADVAVGAALAAIPFAAIGWLFLAH
jgi:hypothetical protein